MAQAYFGEGFACVSPLSNPYMVSYSVELLCCASQYRLGLLRPRLQRSYLCRQLWGASGVQHRVLNDCMSIKRSQSANGREEMTSADIRKKEQLMYRENHGCITFHTPTSACIFMYVLGLAWPGVAVSMQLTHSRLPFTFRIR